MLYPSPYQVKPASPGSGDGTPSFTKRAELELVATEQSHGRREVVAVLAFALTGVRPMFLAAQMASFLHFHRTAPSRLCSSKLLSAVIALGIARIARGRRTILTPLTDRQTGDLCGGPSMDVPLRACLDSYSHKITSDCFMLGSNVYRTGCLECL